MSKKWVLVVSALSFVVGYFCGSEDQSMQPINLGEMTINFAPRENSNEDN